MGFQYTPAQTGRGIGGIRKGISIQEAIDTGVCSPDTSNITILDDFDVQNFRPGYVDIISGEFCLVVSHSSSGSAALLDISDPLNISQIDVIVSTNFDRAKGVEKDPDTDNFFFTAGENGITSVDISDPNNITIGDNSGGGLPSFNGIGMEGDEAYIGDSGSPSAFRVYDVSDETNISEIGNVTISGGGAINSVDADRGTDEVYCALGDSKVESIDVSDPANPTILDEIEDTTDLEGAEHIRQVGDFLYVSARLKPGVTILDASDPSNLSIVGTTSELSTEIGGNTSTDLFVTQNGDTVYLNSDTGGSISAIDTSDKNNPTFTSSLTTGDVPFGIVIDPSTQVKYIADRDFVKSIC